MVTTLDTVSGFKLWLTSWDVAGLSLGGRPPDFNGNRHIKGRRRTRRETVPRHILAAAANGLLWMHEQGGDVLPSGGLFALREKYDKAPHPIVVIPAVESASDLLPVPEVST
jgi:hypothetical protein